jgi:hypothetical protein
MIQWQLMTVNARIQFAIVWLIGTRNTVANIVRMLRSQASQKLAAVASTDLVDKI